ncbi:MAG: GMC family oxidoreductase [Solirubrobacterales bacterium]
MGVATGDGILIALCDTLFPPDPEVADGAWGFSASQLGVADRVAAAARALPPHADAAVVELLQGLRAQGFAEAPLSRREELLHQASAQPSGRFALKQLKAMVFGDLVSHLGADGRNPVWEAIGYPGPNSAPPSPAEAPKTIPVERVDGAEALLEADACIVGSGAGGSVVAARLAEAGLTVLVLEAGSYRNEADFRQLEAEAGSMFLGGGTVWAEQGELALLAGSGLGGGTVINSLACRPTPEDVRANWAALGLEGVDGPEWEEKTKTVWEKLGVNTEATRYNRNAEKLIEGLTACGLEHHRIPRNASIDDDPRFCGYCNAGCQQGCKRSTLKNYLEDAARAGARFVVDCFVDRLRTEEGRVAGVEARVGATRLEVKAPLVVVAAGGIESPALLLRSGIGGPAVGKNLRVHPAYMVTGVYEEPIEAWDGQLITVMSFDFQHCEGESGFFISPLGLSPVAWAGHSPWTDGRSSRELFASFPRMATWHAIGHDRGSGEVVLDRDGGAVVRWRLEDELDRRVAIRGHIELARIHRAAGAEEVFTFHWQPRRWRRGEDFDAYQQELAAAPVSDCTAYSAHQMGSCRMGSSPASAVADCEGQLHDVEGVWIGDTSAFPTAPGVNPMITAMVLAERTASRILANHA